MSKNYKILIWILIGLFLFGIVFLIFSRFVGEKKLQLISPNGKEELRAGQTHQIIWKSKKIGKVGIMLFKGEDSEVSKLTIAKDIDARNQKYDWEIFVWEKTGQDYKIAVFEYPWQEGNEIDYSDDYFAIIGPQFASCDNLSIEAEWPYIPSDFPNLKKVFITETGWSGDLGGLEGADKKCQEEAAKEEYEGNWKAFLGSDTTLAVDRLNLDGIFVEVGISATLPEGKICHRLLGKNFNEFFQKFSDTMAVNQEKFGESFLDDLENIWLGRINQESKKDCTTVFAQYSSMDPSKNYSFTTTCKNWTTNQDIVTGYPLAPGEKGDFPECYTEEGKRIVAAGLVGLATGIIGEEAQNKVFSPFLGKACNLTQQLICVQQ